MTVLDEHTQTATTPSLYGFKVEPVQGYDMYGISKGLSDFQSSPERFAAGVETDVAAKAIMAAARSMLAVLDAARAQFSGRTDKAAREVLASIDQVHSAVSAAAENGSVPLDPGVVSQVSAIREEVNDEELATALDVVSEITDALCGVVHSIGQTLFGYGCQHSGSATHHQAFHAPLFGTHEASNHPRNNHLHGLCA